MGTKTHGRTQAKAWFGIRHLVAASLTFLSLLVGCSDDVTGGGERIVERYESGEMRSKGYQLAGGTRVGQWTLWFEDGQRRREGLYEHGVKVGLWTSWWKNGQLEEESFYAGGEQDGRTTAWHENGRKSVDGAFVSDHPSGHWTKWWENGRKQYEGRYEDVGKMEGPWTWWHKNGQKEKEGSYENGKMMGVWTGWHENACPSWRGEFKSGQREGQWRRWHENGKKKDEGNYEHGEMLGVWTGWDEEGRVVSEDHYQGGHKVGAPSDELRAQLDLDGFYEKHLDAWGIPILSSRHVSPYALLEARYLIGQMIGDRTDILEAIGSQGVRAVVMGVEEFTSDIPEHKGLPDYYDRRARGLGATIQRPAVSCGEENLLGLKGDPYSTESIFIHEFGHAIHEMGLSSLDQTFDVRLQASYEAAKKKGLWKGTYAAKNHKEYWAEAVQSWFDTNRQNDGLHNHVNTRTELREYDPSVASLCEEVFGDDDWRYTKPDQRTEVGHFAGFNWSTAAEFRWPPEKVAAFNEYQDEQERLRREAND